MSSSGPTVASVVLGSEQSPPLALVCPEPCVPLYLELQQRVFLGHGGQWVTSGPSGEMGSGSGRDSMTKRTMGLGRQKESWIRSQEAQTIHPSLPCICWIALGKSLSLPGHQFPPPNTRGWSLVTSKIPSCSELLLSSDLSGVGWGYCD